MYAIHKSQRVPVSSINHTAHVWLSLSSTISFASAPKNPSMSGSRTRRSRASLTTCVCMSARHSARRRSFDSRRSAARRTSGSFDDSSAGCRSVGPHSHPELSAVFKVSSLTEIIRQFSPDNSRFVHVLMDDPGIVQKDEIVLLPWMCRGIAHKRDVRVALLPDCSRAVHARH